VSGTRLGALFVLAALAAAWWWWPMSEEARVRARLEAIAAAVSSAPGEAPVTRLSRIAALRSDVADDVVIEAPGGVRVEGVDRLLALAGARAQAARGVAVTLADLEVTVGPAGDAADVRGVVQFRDGDGGADAREVTGALRRDGDGRWRLSRATLLDPLERPRPAH
jgi:ketosteroid isomerase-like protein